MAKMGRPVGSTTKPRISDYLSEEGVKKLVAKALEMAEAGNETMLKFCLEQHFGKAIQPVEGNHTGTISLHFDNAFTQQNENSSQ